MLIGVIADDFTGASDIANTLAKGLPGQGGLATSQYMGVPRGAAAPEVEAGVVSLKSRSVPVEDAVAASLEALRWLAAQGCRQLVFKSCPPFTSPPVGNIGPLRRPWPTRSTSGASLPAPPSRRWDARSSRGISSSEIACSTNPGCSTTR